MLNPVAITKHDRILPGPRKLRLRYQTYLPNVPIEANAILFVSWYCGAALDVHDRLDAEGCISTLDVAKIVRAGGNLYSQVVSQQAKTKFRFEL